MDHLSELQALLDELGKTFYTSIGYLQQNAQPFPLHAAGGPAPIIDDTVIRNLADSVVTLCKDIDKTIDKLPGVETTEEDQIRRISQLEKENVELGDRILERVAQAETKLTDVREVLKILARDRAQPDSARWVNS